MNADQVAEMLSSVRLREDNAGASEEEAGEDADYCALKKVENEYERTTQYLLKFVASAIKASDGNMQHFVVAGALKALHQPRGAPLDLCEPPLSAAPESESIVGEFNANISILELPCR